jgi:hypothetical protein
MHQFFKNQIKKNLHLPNNQWTCIIWRLYIWKKLNSEQWEIVNTIVLKKEQNFNRYFTCFFHKKCKHTNFIHIYVCCLKSDS